MRIVVAPDSFKGSATAAQVARGIAAGWRAVRPGDEVVEVPLADGGEGTADVVLAATPGARRRPVSVIGPDGREVDASWVLLPDGTGLVELAAGSGLGLLERPDPLGAHTIGFGMLVAAALDAGVERLVLAIGGSGSTDGGSGVLTALGARILDARGAAVRPGGGALASVASVDLTSLRPLPEGGATVLLDVGAPLAGPRGAAAVFGPQKGASARDVVTLDAGLRHWARVVEVARQELAQRERTDPDTPGAGAAGGAGFGLLVWGATPTSGAEHVVELVGLDALIRTADLVVTGEGRFDEQSAMGKLPSVVAEHAARLGVPCALVAGAIDAPTDGFAASVALADLAGGSDRAIADPVTWLTAAARTLARTARPGATTESRASGATTA